MAFSKGGLPVWEGKLVKCRLSSSTWEDGAGVRTSLRNMQNWGSWNGAGGPSLCMPMPKLKGPSHSRRRQSASHGAPLHKEVPFVATASLRPKDGMKARRFPQVQEVLQKLDQVLPLKPQHKSIVLLNVLAFIDGATAVVIKATELHTGTEEAPAAGTSLMFLVRFLVGLLAFAPALTHQFSAKSALTSAVAAAADGVSETGVVASATLARASSVPLTSEQDPLTSAGESLTSAAEAAAAAAGSLPGAIAQKITSLNMLTSAPAPSLTSASAVNRQLDSIQKTDPQLSLREEAPTVSDGSGALPGSPVESPGVESGNNWENLYLPGMLSGVFMFLGDAGQALGLETSSADHAAVLLTGSVILVPFLEAFSGRKIGMPVWLSALLATAGMVLLEQGSDITSTVDGALWSPSMTHILQSIPVGDCWCLTSSVAFALYMVISEEQCTRTDPLRLAAVQLATTVFLSVLWETWDLHTNGGAAGGALLLRHLAAMPWAAVLFIGVIGTGLASWMELQALQTVNPTTATLVYTTGPLWSAILAYLALGETMDAVSCGGAALILLASVMTQVSAPPKTLRASRALAHPLGAPVENSRGVKSGKADGKEVEQSAIDSLVEMVHKVAERPTNRAPPKLLPVRALADKPRLRKEVVPRLRQLFNRKQR